ncbi:MAG: ExbD/TolR family protein [Luteolibacter sp.]
MKLKRGKLLIDPPGSASSDIAFILIIFFLVCASVQPEDGRDQLLPRAEPESEEPNQTKNPEVSITPNSIVLNGSPLDDASFPSRIAGELSQRKREEDRVVILKSSPQTPYTRWIAVSQIIDRAGGLVTLEVTEEKTIQMK